MSRDSSTFLVLANRLKMQMQRFWDERVSLDVILNNPVQLEQILVRAREDENLKEIAAQIDKELGYKKAHPEPSKGSSDVMAHQEGRLQLPVGSEKEKKEDGKGSGQGAASASSGGTDDKKGKKDPRAYLGGLR